MMKEFLQPAKLLFAETSLLENLAEGSRRQRTRMHCHVSLPTIRMALNLVATTLSYFYESGTNQSCEDLTGGVRHREFRPGSPKNSFPQEHSRRATFSLLPTPRSILERQRWPLRYLGREWLDRGSEHVRNSNPEIQVR